MVLGSSGSGKTSFINCLTSGWKLEKQAPITNKAGVPLLEVGSYVYTPDESEVAVKIWNFKNKEVIYGCYSLFLVRRAVILITMDVRTQPDEVVALLRTIQVHNTIHFLILKVTFDSPRVAVLLTFVDMYKGTENITTRLSHLFTSVIPDVKVDSCFPRCLFCRLSGEHWRGKVGDDPLNTLWIPLLLFVICC